MQRRSGGTISVSSHPVEIAMQTLVMQPSKEGGTWWEGAGGGGVTAVAGGNLKLEHYRG